MTYINTIRDLEASTYGIAGASGNALLKSSGVVGGFGTGHDTGGTTLSGGAAGLGDLYNVLYGQKVWSMLNQEVNALSMIAKRPYTSSGWRILKSRPAGGSDAAFGIGDTDVAANVTDLSAPRADQIGGVEENATLGGADGFRALSPEYTKLFTSPKTIAHLFEFSELGMELAAIDDGVGDIRAIVREDMGKHHAEVQSKMLLMPLERYDNATATNIDRNYTSLMKIVASNKEIAAMANADMTDMGANNGSSSLSGLEDLLKLYGADRSTTVTNGVSVSGSTYSGINDFMSAEVDFGASYSGGARVLTLTILNDMLRRIRVNGGNPKVILTGYDTIQHLSDLLQSQERFMDRKEIVPTHNGVRGVKGSEVGFRVATYYDIPIIPSKDMPSTGLETANPLSDLLILDTDHLWLAVMKPTQYFEDGISNGNPFGVGKLGNQGMYRTMGETCCSFFKGQGKITNLKSA
tara:strand:+ start:18421 stop:19815 length:1395 start_codon:yes stop_codon:yes gene_type:complete